MVGCRNRPNSLQVFVTTTLKLFDHVSLSLRRVYLQSRKTHLLYDNTPTPEHDTPPQTSVLHLEVLQDAPIPKPKPNPNSTLNSRFNKAGIECKWACQVVSMLCKY